MKKGRPSVLLLVAALAGAHLQAQEIVLYPHPDWTSDPVATVAMDDVRLQKRGAVVDPRAAALGWQWGEFDGAFTGYVPDAKIGKDLFPVPGALIHAHPDIDSHVLGTVTEEDLENDKIEIVDRGEWWTVAFSKPVPVFYRDVVVRGQTREEVEEPQPAVAEVVETPMRPVVPPPALEHDESSRSASVNSVGGSLGTTFRGTLQPTRSRMFFLSPPHPYELIDANGRRAAYVDFSEAVLPQPTSSYVGKQVTLYGPWETVGDSRAIVIRARNLNVLPNP